MANEWDGLVAQIDSVTPVAQRVQIDVMDGQFVPSFSFPYNTTMLSTQQFPYTESVHFDVHLMVQHPQEVGHRFIKAGANTIIAQIEGFREGEAERVYSEWKEAGAEVGVSVLLDTPLEDVYPLIDGHIVSMVQIMSIARIGYQGEEFDERALERIRVLRATYPELVIAVDGGVKLENIEVLIEAGADILGVGSAIMKTDSPAEMYTHFSHKLHT